MQRSNWIILIGASLTLSLIGCDNHVDLAITSTPTKVVAETPGIGRIVKTGDLATISYSVMLPSGEELLEHSRFRFLVSTDRPTIIQGINDAVIGMRVGGSRTINCPPHLHWGRRGTGDGKVPPNTNLTIHIKVLAIE